MKIPMLWAIGRSIITTNMMWDHRTSNMKMKGIIIRAVLRLLKMNTMFQLALITLPTPRTTARCLPKHQPEDKSSSLETLQQAILHQPKVPPTDRLWLISPLTRPISTKRRLLSQLNQPPKETSKLTPTILWPLLRPTPKVWLWSLW